MSVLVARSSLECQLYMRLHPCVCGDASASPSQGIHTGPDGLVARYGGPCPVCGRDRTVAFTLDPETPPPDVYGAARPSTIICPGEFALESDRLAAKWPVTIAPPDRPAARTDLGWAIRALEEILKLVPPGADAVPATAFFSDAGRAVHAADPGRFRVPRLNARLGAYRAVRDALL